MLRSVRSGLVEANQELKEFVEVQAQLYDPGKRHRGETWDPLANDRGKKHLRLLMLSLFASLDAVTELTALLFTNCIKGLRVGKADFQDLENWLQKSRVALEGIITPQQSKLEELYDQLYPIVHSQGIEKDWLPLARTYRNRAAHLGTEHFREMRFHDQNLRFYGFLPRGWPWLWEEHIKPASNASASEKPSLNHVVFKLMKQDIVSYLHGLQAKVTSIVGTTGCILDAAYRDFKSFPLNEPALEQLKSNCKEFEFEGFIE